ncbi:MAG: HIT domain-containing protein [Pseudomonadota bacterium]|nr:HIT domain-containing protein [Pseudomonadota bacterium]
MTPEFELDPRLRATSEPLAELPLCQARLQNDARWPWLVLIPRRPGAVELEDLTAEERAALMEEGIAAGAAVRAVGAAAGAAVEKLNLGALGNVVPQLHLHLVGRRRGDPAWPGPVWGWGEPEAYAPQALRAARQAATGALVRGLQKDIKISLYEP